MNELHPLDTDALPAPPTAEPDTDAPSPAFGDALADFERAAPGAAAAEVREVAVGDKVSGTVASIGDTHALVGYGGRSEALLDLAPYRLDGGGVKLAVGQALELFVIEAGDQVTLAASVKTDSHGAMQRLRDAMKAKIPVSGKVTGVNSGGIEIDLGGARGFCPVSQIDNVFVADPKTYVGRSLEFMITKMGDAKGGVVVSRRQLLKQNEAAETKQRIASLKVGDTLEGKVRRLETFGAFVDLGGVDGLVHISEVSHSRVAHPKEVLSEGQKVMVRVLKLETDSEGRSRIGLSIKAALPDPWDGIEHRYQAGQRLEGVVARLTDFGAFLTLAPGIDGLVHVSEAALGRVRHVKDVLAVGDKVEVVVKSVDPAKRRIALSIREAMGGAAIAPTRQPVPGEVVEGRVGSVKPFGVFVDLTDFGPRASALVPREETGETRGADLTTRFKPGDVVRVEMLEPKEGKLRARIEGVTPAIPTPREERVQTTEERPREQREPRGHSERPRGERPMRGGGGGGERGRPTERRDRPERGDRRERPERSSGGRGERSERSEERGVGRVVRATSSPVAGGESELSPMALAFRRAMERAKAKEQG